MLKTGIRRLRKCYVSALYIADAGLALQDRMPTVLHGAVRAGALTTAGLAIGTLLGSAFQSWLRVDIVPIGVYLLPLFEETRASPIVLLDTILSQC